MRKKTLSFLLILAALSTASSLSYAHSSTHFFKLTDSAIEKVLKESNKTDRMAIQASLKAYFEKKGIKFSEHSQFAYDGEQIILVETKKNTELIEAICRDLGLDETPSDEWEYFIKFEMDYSGESSSLRTVRIHWQKEMDGKSVKVIVLKSPHFDKDNILYQDFTQVYESRQWIRDESGGVDPFAQSKAPIIYISSFEVDSKSMDKIYIGTRRPYSDLRSLNQLKVSHNQAGDDNSE